jgi:hypothetical protein
MQKYDNFSEWINRALQHDFFAPSAHATQDKSSVMQGKGAIHSATSWTRQKAGQFCRLCFGERARRFIEVVLRCGFYAKNGTDFV